MTEMQVRVRARCPGPSAQDYLDLDTRPVPAALRLNVNDFLGTEDIDVTRYFSPEFHQAEVEQVWRRVWQMACREEEIPEIGDHQIYDIADDSLLIVRVASGEIKAYFNACLHRGRKLRVHPGNVAELRCPFHGFTWALDGSLKDIPCAWDFEHVDRETWGLPEAKVATWGGFVFINMDPDCMPFERYAGDLPEQMSHWPLEDRYTSVHVAKILPCNWKVAQEAFMEAFHTIGTHPQLLPWMGDANSQYDVLADQPHWDRTITPQGVASPHVAQFLTETDVLESFYESRGFYSAAEGRDLVMAEGEALEPVPPGGSARQVLADRMRTQLTDATGEDYEQVSDAEFLDAINYMLFPNLHPWASAKSSITYRFRPYRNDPDQCVTEVYFLSTVKKGEPRPKPAEIRWVAADEDFASVAELGLLGPVFDQDAANLPFVQQGLHTTRKPGITLGDYQESRIRHFHSTLDLWMSR